MNILQTDIQNFKENINNRSNTELCDFLVVVLIWNTDGTMDWELPHIKSEMIKRGADKKLIENCIKCKDDKTEFRKNLDMLCESMDNKITNER